jgi:hypothetical protein
VLYNAKYNMNAIANNNAFNLNLPVPLDFTVGVVIIDTELKEEAEPAGELAL